MTDTAFDDFLDSDDDEFFVEASNHLLDNDFSFEYTSTKKENASQKVSEATTSRYFESAIVPSSDKQEVSSLKKKISNPYSNENVGCSVTHKENLSQNLSNLCTSSHDKCLEVPSSDKDISESIKIPSECKNVNNNASDLTVCSTSNNIYNDNELSNKSEDCNDEIIFLNISTVSSRTEITESANKDEAVATTSSDCNASTSDVNSTKVATPVNSSYINSRFTPGFTPKAKKRKFLGPAGFLELFDGSKEATPDRTDKMLSMDMEFQNIVSSQYTPEHLSLPSWKKLQSTVSSCSNLHSTAKYYSIQRVLSESSKKKLPKHMVVPVLCVLLKKLNIKGSTVIPIFMDDTGEINGKIDAEVLSKYKEFLVEGTALILKKVTFLCNVLILKDENLVSLYHPQGTEKHPQSLESALQTSEPLKPMNCECLKSSHMKKDSLKNHHTPKCVNQNENRLNSISYQSKKHNLTSQNINNSTPKNYKQDCTKYIQNRTNLNNSASKSATSLIPKPSISKTSLNSQTMRSDAFLEQLLDEDNCMDEFDELLGNLDEKSFMEDL